MIQLAKLAHTILVILLDLLEDVVK